MRIIKHVLELAVAELYYDHVLTFGTEDKGIKKKRADH